MLLHSQIIGEGKPFVILHGFLGMSDNWKTLGKRFAELGFEVHLVDQRNHGRSFHDETFTYEALAQDVSSYCKHHQLKNIVLLGHSMGGKTAMVLATMEPDLVSKLMVADIAPKAYPQHHQDILKALSLMDFSVITSRSEAEEALAVYIKDVGVRMFLLKNLYWKEKGQLGLRMNLPVLSREIAEVGKALESNALYEGPTLFVRGGKSGYVTSEDEMHLKKHFPQATLVTMEGAGHWLHAENPSLFHEIIAKFLLKTP